MGDQVGREEHGHQECASGRGVGRGVEEWERRFGLDWSGRVCEDLDGGLTDKGFVDIREDRCACCGLLLGSVSRPKYCRRLSRSGPK
jgi:hypothetical protein